MCQGLGWLKGSGNDQKGSWPLVWAQTLFNRQRRTTDSASSWASYQISYIDLHTAVRIFLKEKKKRNLLKMYMRSYLSCKISPHCILEKENPVTCRLWCNLSLVYFSNPILCCYLFNSCVLDIYSVSHCFETMLLPAWQSLYMLFWLAGMLSSLLFAWLVHLILQILA